MKIAVFGLGYVGSVTAVCLASDGHEVWGVDKDNLKIDRLKNGIAPIREPGLDERLAEVLKTSRLTVSIDPDEAVRATDTALVCVGTPTSSDGGTDLSFVLKVTEEIGKALEKAVQPYKIFLRSTVPPGAVKDVVLPRLSEASGRVLGQGLELYFNPEFLRQGSALKDFYQAPFTVIGIHPDMDGMESDIAQEVYRCSNAPVLIMNYQEAELLKMACNAFHALKIDFANEIGTLAHHFDADPGRVMNAFSADTKLNISAAYLRPGFAFGGSCLPKDVRSLTYTAEQLGLDLPLHQAILPSNDCHLDRIASRLISMDYQTIGMIGLVFKPNTDDLRESPALKLAQQLLSAGKEVIVYEPEIDLELLIGTNLKYLQEMLPGYADRLVDWDALHQQSDVLLITRSGIVPAQDVDKIELAINLAQLGAW